MYGRYRADERNVVPFRDPNEGFAVRAQAGALPKVSFIDPDFVDLPPFRTASDDHPPARLRDGQALISAIYEAIAASPLWPKTLFVITYDEHGGFYDHVSPPGTTAAPDDAPERPIHPQGPPHYGPRVPAFVISPFAARGAVSRTIFDHTSVLATIARRFLDADAIAQLGPRVAWANDLAGVLTVSQPRTAPRLATTSPHRAPRPKNMAQPVAADRRDHHLAVRRSGLDQIGVMRPV
jgi:phospholipase C